MSDSYRVLVTASRTWKARSVLYAALDDAEQRAYELGCRAVVVVHGGAKGGDTMADDWAKLPSPLPGMERTAEAHPLTGADWHPGGRYDASAGMKRNALMVSLCADECVAALDDCAKTTCRRKKPHPSHGTAHCAGLAERSGITTRRITGDG